MCTCQSFDQILKMFDVNVGHGSGVYKCLSKELVRFYFSLSPSRYDDGDDYGSKREGGNYTHEEAEQTCTYSQQKFVDIEYQTGNKADNNAQGNVLKFKK